MRHELRQFAKRLRETRLARGVTQRELSELCGVPQAQLSRIEAGEVDLRLSTLTAVANALDLQVALIPRKAAPAVGALVRQVEKQTSSSLPAENASSPPPAYSLEEDADA